jgi:glutaredoxin-related protein
MMNAFPAFEQYPESDAVVIFMHGHPIQPSCMQSDRLFPIFARSGKNNNFTTINPCLSLRAQKHHLAKNAISTVLQADAPMVTHQ